MEMKLETEISKFEIWNTSHVTWSSGMSHMLALVQNEFYICEVIKENESEVGSDMLLVQITTNTCQKSFKNQTLLNTTLIVFT